MLGGNASGKASGNPAPATPAVPVAVAHRGGVAGRGKTLHPDQRPGTHAKTCCARHGGRRPTGLGEKENDFFGQLVATARTPALGRAGGVAPRARWSGQAPRPRSGTNFSRNVRVWAGPAPPTAGAATRTASSATATTHRPNVPVAVDTAGAASRKDLTQIRAGGRRQPTLLGQDSARPTIAGAANLYGELGDGASNIVHPACRWPSTPRAQPPGSGVAGQGGRRLRARVPGTAPVKPWVTGTQGLRAIARNPGARFCDTRKNVHSCHHRGLRKWRTAYSVNRVAWTTAGQHSAPSIG